MKENPNCLKLAINVPKIEDQIEAFQSRNESSDSSGDEFKVKMLELVLSVESANFKPNVESHFSSVTSSGNTKHHWHIPLDSKSITLDSMQPQCEYIFILCATSMSVMSKLTKIKPGIFIY